MQSANIVSYEDESGDLYVYDGRIILGDVMLFHDAI